MALLKNLFNKAIGWGKCEHNPVTGIKQFKESHRIRYLTKEEEEKLRYFFPPEYWPWVEIALHTGFRQSEQFELRWENVDFQIKVITIPDSKNGEVRYVPMNDKVVKIFRSLPSRLKGPWVFPSANWHTPKDPHNFTQRIFLPAVRKAGIDDFRWHDLRHTFASRLVMKGTDLRTVQDLMGHKTITMTQRYAHLSPEHQREAVQRLADEESTDTKTDTTKKQEAASVG